jgi:dTDP-4-dehydrorhamnose reductase
MKVAVLGSSGFLGSYILHNLQGCVVYPVTRKTVDLTDTLQVREWLLNTTPNVIVNCATAGGKTKMGEVSFTELQNNLSVFLSFYNNSDLVHKFINVGSGSEFDVSKDINLVQESDIINSAPAETYGYSKNIISRMILEKENFYTLRLFGCFDKSEPDFRLFKKVVNGEVTSISDRYFDYFSASDFAKVLRFYIKGTDLPNDINCVYQKKYLLSQTLDKLKKVVQVNDINPNNYTGNGDKLAALDLKLDGLEKGLIEYIS